MGLISTLEGKCLSAHQLNFSPSKDQSGFGLTAQSYMQYKCCSYFASLYAKYDLMNLKAGTIEKKAKLGYSWQQAQLCLGLEQATPSSWGQFCGLATMGLYYTGLPNKKIGLFSEMDKCNWRGMKHSLAYEAKIGGRNIKAKIDTDQRLWLSTSQGVAKGGEMVFSMGYSHKEQLKGGCSPVTLGLKLRFNE